MFRHAVMIRWAEEATDEQKQALRDGLTALPGEIPEIRSYRFGDDIGLADDNYDMVLVADFDTRDDYVLYRDHPAHQKLVADLLRPVVDARAAVQHEWQTALPTDLPG